MGQKISTVHMVRRPVSVTRRPIIKSIRLNSNRNTNNFITTSLLLRELNYCTKHNIDILYNTASIQ